MVTTIMAGNRRQRSIFLREWREHLHLTQDQLADRMETSKATVSRIESGARPYKEGFVEAAAEALGIGVRDLFRDPTTKSLDDMLADAPESVRRQAQAIVETLLKTGT